MEGGPFDDQSFNDYNNQPLPSLSSTLLNKNNDVHSIQVSYIKLLIEIEIILENLIVEF